MFDCVSVMLMLWSRFLISEERVRHGRWDRLGRKDRVGCLCVWEDIWQRSGGSGSILVNCVGAEVLPNCRCSRIYTSELS